MIKGFVMFKKIYLPVILFAIGAAAIIGSIYIKAQVSEGRKEIAAGKKKLDKGKGLFSFTPVTKEIGKGIESYGRKKIAAGTKQADFYENVSNWLLVGGFAFIIAGGIVMIVTNKKKK
jgi:hypothetical protein